MFVHPNNMMLVFGILGVGMSFMVMETLFSATYPFFQVLEDLDFHKRLVMESLFIPDYLDSHRLSSSVITALQHLPK